MAEAIKCPTCGEPMRAPPLGRAGVLSCPSCHATRPLGWTGDVQPPPRGKRTVYTASKTKHAARWRNLREQGAMNVIATWIDEAGPGESADLADLARRCIDESVRADVFILYAEPGDVLKGALMEAGARLAVGKLVYCVGECESLKTALTSHPLWRRCRDVNEAYEMALRHAHSQKVQHGT